MGAAACTSTASGTATPSTAAAPTTRLAPAITAPQVNLAAAEANPCSVLDTSALSALGLAGPGVSSPTGKLGLGPECAWQASQPSGPRLTIRVNNQTGGIEGAYQRRSSFAVFTPLTVDGYPAVNAQAIPGDTDCSLSVGVNDTQLLGVDYIPSFGTAESSDPCGKASEIATQVITKLAG
ncbi:DUF3558 domain-containing protein [Rhodococcus aerolatus]